MKKQKPNLLPAFLLSTLKNFRMKILIIEDEEFAARRLESLILECASDIEILARLESVKKSVEWLKNNDLPDLIFLDIHLEDNLSFAIFEEVQIDCPVIFTTATDLVSTAFFKENHIDFLLKPIIHSELKALISKYLNPSNSIESNFKSELYQKLLAIKKRKI